MAGILRNVFGDVTEPQKQTDREIVIIPHCCNNISLMGAGVALSLKKKWEIVAETYFKFCADNKNKFPILGKTNFVKIDNHFVVANMIAQNEIVSKNNPIPIKYKALADCMTDVWGYIEMIRAQTNNPAVIHCPKFGSDLAGGNWLFILELIREIWLENGIDVVVYEFEPDKKKWGPIE